MSARLTPSRWRRVNDLFHEAALVPPDERAAWLAEHCAGDEALRREVESLLAADDPMAGDEQVAAAIDRAIDTIATSPSASNIPERVGAYRILHELGSGGMAAVFLAVRDDDEFEQRVAIKVVKGTLSREALRRFRAERQILASLEHPAIARLLDGGTTTQGMPYLVMEYVDGVPIDQYCSERELDVPARLRLFTRVCDAVNHAHRSLVVHRDIKPANILVTPEGEPKLLDFGIAKLLDEERAAGMTATLPGLGALTPEYASPEQVRGEPITTASDVYSLGILLFELLTGVRPFAFDTQRPAEIERVVATVEPPKPSTVAGTARASRVEGDLDTIVLKALEKAPDRRYVTAAHLADDVRRYLDGLPVLARPATWRYRAGRFARRHRAAVAAAAIVGLLIVGFTVALALQVRRVSSERDTAERLTSLLLEMYGSFDPLESRGTGVTAQEVLDRGASRIEAELRDQPVYQARMLDAIGALYGSVGLHDRAVAVLERSLAVRQTIGADTLDGARTLNQLANAMRERGRFADAEPSAERALAIRRERAGPRAPDTADSLSTLGLIRTIRGRVIDGGALIAEAVEIWRSTTGPDSPEFAKGVRNLVRTWRERADYPRADAFERGDLLKVERFERELLAARRKTFGDTHPLTAESQGSLGQLLHAMGRDREAEPLLREALATRRATLGRETHPGVIEAIHNLALALHDQRKLDEAVPLYRSSVALLRKGLPNHPQIAINLNNYGSALEDAGTLAEAEAAYREAIGIRRALVGRERVGVARTLGNLARVLAKQGREADALRAAEEAVAIDQAELGASHAETARATRLRDSLAGNGHGRRD